MSRLFDPARWAARARGLERRLTESTAALDPESRQNIGASVMHELQRFNDGDGVTYPEEIHVVTARIQSDPETS